MSELKPIITLSADPEKMTLPNIPAGMASHWWLGNSGESIHFGAPEEDGLFLTTFDTIQLTYGLLFALREGAKDNEWVKELTERVRSEEGLRWAQFYRSALVDRGMTHDALWNNLLEVCWYNMISLELAINYFRSWSTGILPDPSADSKPQ